MCFAENAIQSVFYYLNGKLREDALMQTDDSEWIMSEGKRIWSMMLLLYIDFKEDRLFLNTNPSKFPHECSSIFSTELN